MSDKTTGWTTLDPENFKVKTDEDDLEILFEDESEEDPENDSEEEENNDEDSSDEENEDSDEEDSDQDDSDEDSDEEDEEPKPKKKGSRANRRIRQLASQKKKLEEELENYRTLSNTYKESLTAEKERTSSVTKAVLEKNAEDLRKRIEEAGEDGDVVKALRLNTELNKVEKNIDTLEAYVKAEDPAPKKKVEENKQVNQEASLEDQIALLPEAGQTWIEDNPKFFQDEKFKVKAIAHGRILEVEGFDPETDEYWEELSKRVTGKVSKTKMNPKRKRKGVSPVNNSSRAGKSSNKRTVRLSQEQRDLVEEFGLDPKEYAKRVLELEDNGKTENSGYTKIKIG